jgi:hypothetical protein
MQIEARELFNTILPSLATTAVANNLPANPFALPPASLKFLCAAAKAIGAKRVFEFGSGQSTVAFLKEGLEVTSLEDTDFWMQETRKLIPTRDLSIHHPHICPMTSVFQGGAPFLAWRCDGIVARFIQNANLILIDSPAAPASREYLLLNCLKLANQNALIILDDIKIKPVSRFVDRIAKQNPRLLFFRATLDHGLGLFMRQDDTPIMASRTPLDLLKTWRRYWLAVEQDKKSKDLENNRMS